MTKSDGLLSVIASSEKRKGSFLFLRGGPHNLDDIKEHVDVRRSPEILPRLKELEASTLITKQDGIYNLSVLGKVIAKYYQPLLDTIEAIESNIDFWNNHDLSAIPDKLLDRIQELKECKKIEAESYNINESHREFLINVTNSKRFMGVSCIIRQSWIKLFLNLASNGVPVDIIITKDIFEYILKEYSFELEAGLKNKDAHIYICEKLNTSFAITDSFFSLSLNYLNGHHDTKNDLMGFDKTSITWGEDLYNYYLENSIEVKSAEPINEAFTQEQCPQSLLMQLP